VTIEKFVRILRFQKESKVKTIAIPDENILN